MPPSTSSSAHQSSRKPASLPYPESTKSFWHTEPSPLLLGHRSTRNLPESADIVVIGSGITGTSIAHHLLEQDPTLNVVMLEAREACWGATGRNGGHCQPLLFSHPTDPSIGHFELQNLHTLEKLIAEQNVDCEFVVQPGIQATYDIPSLEIFKCSLKTMETTAPDLLSHMRLVTDPLELSQLKVPSAKGAIVTDLAARLWPYKFVSHILSSLLTTHAASTFNLQTLTPVTALESSLDSSTGGGVEVRTDRGTLLAKKVICATNAYTSHLLPQFSDLIVPCRGQMSALIPLPGLVNEEGRVKTSLGFSATGEEDYLIQRPSEKGGELMFGGGRSKGGATIGVTDDSAIDPEIEEYLRGRLPRVLSGFSSSSPDSNEGGKGGEERRLEGIMWTGIMGFSRDEKPWIGEVPGQGGIFVAAGFTGHGMPNSWLSGKAVAELCLASFEGVDAEMAVHGVCERTGLPGSYCLSEGRMRAAVEECRDMGVVDAEEMERGNVLAAEAAKEDALVRNHLWVD